MSMLLDTTVNGMQDITFTTKDVIYIVSLVISILAGWFLMQMKIQGIEQKIELEKTVTDNKMQAVTSELVDLSDTLEKEALSAKVGRSNLRKEMDEKTNTYVKNLNERIDKVQEQSVRSYEKLENKIEELRKQQTTDTEKIIEIIKQTKK